MVYWLQGLHFADQTHQSIVASDWCITNRPENDSSQIWSSLVYFLLFGLKCHFVPSVGSIHILPFLIVT